MSCLSRKQQREGLAKRLAISTVDDPEVVLLGRETIHRDGERVGWLTSGGFGYTLGAPIGIGYVRRAAGVEREWLLAGRYELEVAGERVPCTAHLRGPFDPANERVRG